MVKNLNKKTKKLKKRGWVVSGSSLTLQAAIMKHKKNLNSDDNNEEIIGEVSMCNSNNICKANALNNALREYADKAGSYVKGRVTSDMFNNASSVVPEEFDKFYAAYERLVGAEIKGELKYSLALEKNNGDSKSYQAWYIVNKEAAHQARLRAMQQAAAETKLAQEYANKISKFVNEAFE